MIKWLKKLFKIVRDYDTDKHYMMDNVLSSNRINMKKYNKLEQLIKDRTELHVDIHTRKYPTSVIVIGKYHGLDYVRTFNLLHDDINDLVQQLKYMEQRYGEVRRIDATPCIRAIVKNELNCI